MQCFVQLSSTYVPRSSKMVKMKLRRKTFHNFQFPFTAENLPICGLVKYW